LAARQPAPSQPAESNKYVASESPLSLAYLGHLSWPELEALYRTSSPGAIPRGFLRGKVLYCRNSFLAGVRSATSNALWKGKVFDDSGSGLVNQWICFRAVRADVRYGPSWLDDGSSIVMDYATTSRVWSDVRDELREVAPGLYLGRMYHRRPCGPVFELFFVLQACPTSGCGP
jgi:hypothetical protein